MGDVAVYVAVSTRSPRCLRVRGKPAFAHSSQDGVEHGTRVRTDVCIFLCFKHTEPCGRERNSVLGRNQEALAHAARRTGWA